MATIELRGITVAYVQIEPILGNLAALRVDVDLDLVERLGTETIAHGDLAGLAGLAARPGTAAAAWATATQVRPDQELAADAERTRFAAALDSRVTVTPGTLLPLYVPVERLHLFDATTGVSLHTDERRRPDQAST
jgi:multiple sugar transport system ATP-binding protein